MSSLRGGLRPPFQQPGLPAERGDQALDRFYEPLKDCRGRFYPPFLLTIPKEGERVRQDSLPDGRTGSRPGP